MMEYQVLKMNKSPFYKKSHHDSYKHGNPKIPKSIRIPKDAHDDLMAYYNGIGIDEISEVLNQLICEKLEMINTFKRRKVFNNIELIMLIPKTDDRIELEDKSRIIALYNTDEDFIDGFNHLKRFPTKFNYQYDMKPFGESFFRSEMNIINNTKESPVYRVNKRDLSRWESLSQRLESISREEEWDLNVRDCYFVRCPLNNFLDVKREGQYQSNLNHRGDHDGIYVFDLLNARRLYCIINWNYSLENGNIGFNIEFLNQRQFMEILEESDFKTLRESYSKLNNSDYDRERLDKMIEGEERWLEFLKHEREKM